MVNTDDELDEPPRRRERTYQRVGVGTPMPGPPPGLPAQTGVDLMMSFMTQLQQQQMQFQREQMQMLERMQQNQAQVLTSLVEKMQPKPVGASGSSTVNPSGNAGDLTQSSSLAVKDPKWLPALPELQLGRLRGEEIEAFAVFLEKLTNWLALTHSSYPKEIKIALNETTEITQELLPFEQEERSTRLYHLLTQCCSKQPKCMDLLRTVSLKQNHGTPGYEAVRILYQEYSLKSRNEAICSRDEFLKTRYSRKTLGETVRAVENSVERLRLKLGVVYQDLFPTEPDRCVVLVQNLPQKVKEHVSLNSDLSSWATLVKDLSFYESQLRILKPPDASRFQRLDDDDADRPGRLQKPVGPCFVCGKPGHIAKDCNQKRGRSASRTSNLGKNDEKGKSSGKGKKGKGRGKGKGFGKKGDLKNRSDAAMKMQNQQDDTGHDAGEEDSVAAENFMAVFHVGHDDEEKFAPLLTTVEDFACLNSVSRAGVGRWLVDSGATVHVISSKRASRYEVRNVRTKTPKLLAADEYPLKVQGMADVSVMFQGVSYWLIDCFIVDVPVNVLSPFRLSLHGWDTCLGKDAALIKGSLRLPLKLEERAWWISDGNLPLSKPRGVLKKDTLDLSPSCQDDLDRHLTVASSLATLPRSSDGTPPMPQGGPVSHVLKESVDWEEISGLSFFRREHACVLS